MADRIEPTWLVNPPEPGQVHFHFEAAEGVSLSDEARRALETLARELLKQEESPTDAKCSICSNQCVEYSIRPCFSLTSCKICKRNAMDPGV